MLQSGPLKASLSTHLLAYHPFKTSFPDLLRESGFRDVEMWCMIPHFDYRDPARVEGARRRFEEAGVRVRSVHLPFYRSFDGLKTREKLSPIDPRPEARETALIEAEMAIAAAAALGAAVAVLHLGEPGEPFDPAAESRSLRAIERLGTFAASRSVALALENILSDLTDVGRLRTLVRRTGLANVGLCVDVGHSHVGGSALRDVEAAGDLLRNAHLHDNDGRADQHRPPGEGTVPWRELMRSFRKAAYAGWHAWEIRDESRGGTAPETLLRGAAERIRKAFPPHREEEDHGSSSDHVQGDRAPVLP